MVESQQVPRSSSCLSGPASSLSSNLSSGIAEIQSPSSSPHSSMSRLRMRSTGTSAHRASASQHLHFPSTRLKEPPPKPWTQGRSRGHLLATIIYWTFFAAGVALMGGVAYIGIASVQRLGNVCIVLNEDFSQGIRSDVWNYEVQLGGFGNGQFEWTTSSPDNAFVEEGKLYIVPTLTQDTTAVNLTGQGICSSDKESECAALTNETLRRIVNPVQSARMNTKGKYGIKYGKVEVKAKLPKGDWLWPAIWMLPVDDAYGTWPASGEIDIVEARGNNHTYGTLGINNVNSALHFGPNSQWDAYGLTQGSHNMKTTNFAAAFHTYTLEWNEDFITTYIDDQNWAMVNLRTSKTSFWDRGQFPSSYMNQTNVQSLINPWLGSATNAPFDKEFYLILNVAVGGTNGWFPDNMGNKPWSDGSTQAMWDFWQAKDKWYRTWGETPTERGMAIDSVKMWQKC